MLYLKDIKRDRKDTIKSFFFKIFNNDKYSNFGNLNSTFSDKNCNNQECYKKIEV